MNPITRRELLSKTTVLFLVPVAAACSSNNSSGGGGTGNGCSGIFETSTDTGHNHTVALTQAQLQQIESGTAVTVTTSSPASHNFTISK